MCLFLKLVAKEVQSTFEAKSLKFHFQFFNFRIPGNNLMDVMGNADFLENQSALSTSIKTY